MIPQTLLGSLSAHVQVPRSSPSSAFPIAPTDWHAGCPSDGEVYEEGPWRGVLLNEWYLLGRIRDWEQSGVAERDASSDIEWAPSPSVEPLLRTRSAASTKAEDARELEIWWGSPRSPGGKVVRDREPRWIAIHARSLRPLPYLIKHWGTPPEPVLADWKRQCGILGLQTQSIWILASSVGILYRIDETRTSPSLIAVHRTTRVANPLQKNSKRAGYRAVHRGLPAAGLLVLVVVIGWMLRRGVPATCTKMHSIPTISEKKEKEGVSKESTLLPQPLPSLESREIPQELGEIPELVTDPDLALLDSDIHEDWKMANTMGGSSLGVEQEPILPFIDLALFSQPSHISDEVSDTQTPLAANQVLGFHGEAKHDDVSDSELLEIESVAEGIRRVFPVSGGLARHRIGTGSSIAAARATCLATLSMIDNSHQGLSITPSDASMLLGESTQQWVVALEEEAPELIVELESRPARRWELRIKTGVREHRHALTYWLHAGQASRVLDQMDLGRRSAESELGRMQSMLDGGQSMGPFSPRQRRRQLQQLDKELERCIEIWKVVERLSLIVLDQAQIAVELQTPTQFPSQAVSPPEKVSNR